MSDDNLTVEEIRMVQIKDKVVRLTLDECKKIKKFVENRIEIIHKRG